MQLVCFAVNYVGSAMAKTRLKTSSASEIGVTGEMALTEATIVNIHHSVQENGISKLFDNGIKCLRPHT